MNSYRKIGWATKLRCLSVAFALTLIVAENAHAYNEYEETSAVYVTRVWVTAGSDAYFSIQGTGFTYCQYSDMLHISGNNYKEKLAALMTAVASGKKVIIYAFGCSGGGSSGYPIAQTVSLTNQ